MDFLSNPFIAMIVMLGALVVFHELGHYLVGRWCGVAVEVFSVGFGAPIFSRKVGHTTYQVAWIPLGGFVKFFGASRNEDVPDSAKGQLYFEALPWKRALIVLAGPVFNLLLAFLIFWVIVMKGMDVPPASIGDVLEGSRAQEAGIIPGDVILKIDDKSVRSWTDIERSISRNPEKKLSLLIKRQEQDVELTLIPKAVPGITLMGTKSMIGRAGVALGYPSAIVTIPMKDSIFALAGIQTGEQILQYSLDGEKFIEINGFHDLLKKVVSWNQQALESVSVKVAKMSPAAASAENTSRKSDLVQTSQSRIVVFSPKEWPKYDAALSLRSYAERLGVFDSHLTIANGKGLAAGLIEKDDVVKTWNGQPIVSIYQLQEIMNENLADSVLLGVIRNGAYKEIKLPLKGNDIQRAEGPVRVYTPEIEMLGALSLPEPWRIQHSNPFVAAKFAIQEGYHQTYMMVSSFVAILTGQMPVKALGSFISIAKVASDSAKAGALTFLVTMAVISINLALVNLFPIPILDGGQLLMIGAEAIKGSPLAEKTVENFHKLGFIMVMSLVVLAMYNDLSRYWKSMIGVFTGNQ
jgi:regulator of sigma E protease